MVDAMTRPLDSWGHDLYAPRHTSFYPQDQNPPALRLPPPSSLVNDAHHTQTALNERERALHSHSFYRDVYAPVASMPAHRPVQVPILGSESHASTLSSSSRGLVDTRARLSPAHSSTTSDPSEDPSDYYRLRQFAPDQKSSPVSRPSSHFASVHESPSRQPSRVDTRSMRPSQDAQSQHTRLGTSSQASSPVHQTWSPHPEPRAPEQRMKIADLLSNEQSSAPESSKALQKAPQRPPTSAAVTSTYRISIRQQPVAARSCGYGERDRRVIDPPPIIQMSIEDPTASEEDIRNRLTHSYSIMHCTIWNEAGDQDLSSMPEDYRTQRRLMGTVVSSPFAGNDENDEYGCFFCFPDLSCRTPGSFRLQFSFMVLDPLSSPGHRTPVVAIVMSDVFTVYNAKDFPGMKASTALTKRLKEQGCLISIKKGNDRTRTREGSESEDDYDEDAQGGSSQRRSKRARKT
ncbi:hypothetical protein ANO14919_113060 [Xylariales sp. No.14919]|nr:hypothetical protein F5X98DRAFT_138919 [Xylaria grammica]GAW21781.1 hypothetical protein ANO14919_113060 [Xylariales sp. No.14919]